MQFASVAKSNTKLDNRDFNMKRVLIAGTFTGIFLRGATMEKRSFLVCGYCSTCTRLQNSESWQLERH